MTRGHGIPSSHFSGVPSTNQLYGINSVFNALVSRHWLEIPLGLEIQLWFSWIIADLALKSSLKYLNLFIHSSFNESIRWFPLRWQIVSNFDRKIARLTPKIDQIGRFWVEIRTRLSEFILILIQMFEFISFSQWIWWVYPQNPKQIANLVQFQPKNGSFNIKNRFNLTISRENSNQIVWI